MTAPDDMRAFNRSVIDEFRANRGRVGHEPLKDARLVLLTTHGARTGRPHTTPLSYFEDGPNANPTIAAHQDRTERETPLVVIDYDPRDPRYHPDGM